MLRTTLDHLMTDLDFEKKDDVYTGKVNDATYIVDTAQHPYRIYREDDACMFSIANQLQECFRKLQSSK